MRPVAVQGRAFGHRGGPGHVDGRFVVFNGDAQFGRGFVAVGIRDRQVQAVDGHAVHVRGHCVIQRVQQRGLHGHVAGGPGRDARSADQFEFDDRNAVLVADQVVAHLAPGHRQFHTAGQHLGRGSTGAQFKGEPGDVVGTGREAHVHRVRVFRAVAGVGVVQGDVVAQGVARIRVVPARAVAAGDVHAVVLRDRVAVGVGDFHPKDHGLGDAVVQVVRGLERPRAVGLHGQDTPAGVDGVADVVFRAVEDNLQAARAVRIVVVRPAAGGELTFHNRGRAGHVHHRLVVFNRDKQFGQNGIAVGVRGPHLQTFNGHAVHVRGLCVIQRVQQRGLHRDAAGGSRRDCRSGGQFQFDHRHAVLVADQVVADLGPGDGQLNAAGDHLGRVRTGAYFKGKGGDVVRTGQEADRRVVRVGRAVAGVGVVQSHDVAAAAGINPTRTVAAGDGQAVGVGGGVAVFIGDLHAEAHVLGNAVVQVVRGLEGPGAVGLHRQDTLAGVDGVADVVLRAVNDNLQVARAVRVVGMRPVAVQGRAFGHRGGPGHVDRGLVVFNRHAQLGRGRVAVNVGNGQAQAVDGHAVHVRGHFVIQRVQQRGFHGHGAGGAGRDGRRADQFEFDDRNAVLVADQVAADLGPGHRQFHAAGDHLGRVRAGTQFKGESGDAVGTGREAHVHGVRLGSPAAGVGIVQGNVVAQTAVRIRVVPARAVAAGDGQAVRIRGAVAVFIGDLHAEAHVLGNAVVQVVCGLEGPGAVGVHRQDALAGVDGGAEAVFRAVEDNLQAARAVRIVVVRPVAVQGRAFGHRGGPGHVDGGLVVFNGDAQLGRGFVAVGVDGRQAQAVDGHAVHVRGHCVIQRVQQRGLHGYVAGGPGRDARGAGQFEFDDRNAVLVADQVVADLGPGHGQFHAAGQHLGRARAGAQVKREGGDVVGTGREAHVHGVRVFRAAAGVGVVQGDVVAQGVARIRVVPARAVAAGDVQAVVLRDRVVVGVGDFHPKDHGLGNAVVQVVRGLEGPGAVGVHGQDTLAGVDGVADVILGIVEDNLQSARAVRIVVVRPVAVQGRAFGHRGGPGHGDRGLVVVNRHAQLGRGFVAVDVGNGQAQAVDGHAVRVRGHFVFQRVQQRGLYGHVAGGPGRDGRRGNQFELNHRHAVLVADQVVADLGPGDGQLDTADGHSGCARAGAHFKGEPGDVVGTGREAHVHGV